jgi:hypothetical protein
MKTPLAILFVLTVMCLGASAQQRSKNSLEGMPWNERVFFGGGGTFGGGTGVNGRYTYFAVNPLAGYRVTVPFSVGTSINYILFNYPDIGEKASQFGVSPFVQYRVGRLFGYAEYSIISVPNADNTFRSTYTRIPVGLGYTQPIGPRAAVNFMLLYDLKFARNNSPFTTPWILRVFITAGGISM